MIKKFYETYMNKEFHKNEIRAMFNDFICIVCFSWNFAFAFEMKVKL